MITIDTAQQSNMSGQRGLFQPVFSYIIHKDTRKIHEQQKLPTPFLPDADVAAASAMLGIVGKVFICFKENRPEKTRRKPQPLHLPKF